MGGLRIAVPKVLCPFISKVKVLLLIAKNVGHAPVARKKMSTRAYEELCWHYKSRKTFLATGSCLTSSQKSFLLHLSVLIASAKGKSFSKSFRGSRMLHRPASLDPIRSSWLPSKPIRLVLAVAGLPSHDNCTVLPSASAKLGAWTVAATLHTASSDRPIGGSTCQTAKLHACGEAKCVAD